MSLADWLADGADPAKMTLEEVRRRRNALSVREEQAASQLEHLLTERESLFLRGARTRSEVLRRLLARRHARMETDVRALDRELSRIGKELAGLACIRLLLRDRVELKAPGDCTPLLTLLDDASATEQEFADLIFSKLRGGSAGDSLIMPARQDEPGVLDVWRRLDRGEFSSPEEALDSLEDR